MKNFADRIGMKLGFLLVLTIGGVVATGCSHQMNLVPIYEEKTIDVSNVSTLHIHTEFTRINVVPSSSQQIHVNLHGEINENYRDKIALRVNEKNNDVKIQIEEPKNYRNLNTKEHQLDIELPQQIFEKIYIVGTTADIDIQGIKANHFQADSEQGIVNLKDLAGNQVQLNSFTGDQTLNNIDGDIKVNTNQGRVTFIGEMTTGDVSVVTNVSDIDLTQVKLPESWEADIKTNQGFIQGSLDNYTFEKHSDKVMKGLKGTDGPKINIQTKQGNIKLP